MKKLFFTLIIIIISIVSISDVFANDTLERCENLRFKPKIHLKGSFGRLTYDNTLNYKQLKAKVNRDIHGLASVRYDSHLRVDFELKEKGTGVCVVPKSVNVYVGIVKPTIYIAKELNPGECEYNLVLRHEQAHMQMNIRTYEHFLKVAPDALEEVARGIKPVYIRSEKDFKKATELIAKEYNYVVVNFVDQLRSETDIEHEKLDGNTGQIVESTVCGIKIRFH